MGGFLVYERDVTLRMPRLDHTISPTHTPHIHSKLENSTRSGDVTPVTSLGKGMVLGRLGVSDKDHFTTFYFTILLA